MTTCIERQNQNEMQNLLEMLYFFFKQNVIYTLKGCEDTYKAHLTLNYCICMRLEVILNPQCNNNNLQAVIWKRRIYFVKNWKKNLENTTIFIQK